MDNFCKLITIYEKIIAASLVNTEVSEQEKNDLMLLAKKCNDESKFFDFDTSSIEKLLETIKLLQRSLMSK